MSANSPEAIPSPFVWHPQTAAEAWQLKQSLGASAVYTAGSTLLRTQWESGVLMMPEHFIDLSRIQAASDISVGKGGIVIPSMATLAACRGSSLIQRRKPLLAEALSQIAAPSVRNLATLGGNICSLIGDALPALLVYDARLVLFGDEGEHKEPLADWLLTASQRGVGKDSRLLLAIEVPLSELPDNLPGRSPDSSRTDGSDRLTSNSKRFGAYYKVGRREAFTPSVVTAALSGTMSEKGVLSGFRLAAGGGQTVPCRLEEVEREFNGSVLNDNTLRQLYDRLLASYEPKGDLFASADYRKQTAANLIVAELWKTAAEAAKEGG